MSPPTVGAPSTHLSSLFLQEVPKHLLFGVVAVQQIIPFFPGDTPTAVVAVGGGEGRGAGGRRGRGEVGEGGSPLVKGAGFSSLHQHHLNGDVELAALVDVLKVAEQAVAGETYTQNLSQHSKYILTSE